MNSRIAFVAVGAVLALAACSRHKVKDKEAPAALVALRESLPVQRLWSASVGGDKPVLRLGLGLGLEGERVFAAGHDGDVAAFDLKSGHPLWRTRTKAGLSGGTGAGAGVVAVGALNGEVIALKSTDGSVLWRTKVGGEVLSAPAVAEKLIVVRTVDGRLHGLSVADGKEVWREEQQIPRLTLRGAASPTILGDAVYCGFDNGKVLALSLADGAKLWEATVSPPRGRTELERLVDIDSGVRVTGDNVLAVGYQGRAAMLARDSGQVWWSRDVSSYRGLDVDEDGVVIATAGGQLLMLSRRTGTEQWHNDSLLHRHLSAPTIVGDVIAVADSDGLLHWFDRQSGEAVARDKVGDAVSTAPIAIDGELLLITDKGRIEALKPGVRRVTSAAPAPKTEAGPAQP